MVWTDYDAASLLPDAMKVGTATIPFAVERPRQARERSVVGIRQQRLPERTYGAMGRHGLARPRFGARRQKGRGARRPQRCARRRRHVCSEQNYGWRDFESNYWLDTIAFGMEFGPENADPYGDGPTHFSLDLDVLLPRSRSDGRASCVLSARFAAVEAASPWSRLASLCAVGDRDRRELAGDANTAIAAPVNDGEEHRAGEADGREPRRPVRLPDAAARRGAAGTPRRELAAPARSTTPRSVSTGRPSPARG